MSPKEIENKALHLQGDYLRCYEDMLEALVNYISKAERSLETAREAYYIGRMDELRNLRHFLGLDKQ